MPDEPTPVALTPEAAPTIPSTPTEGSPSFVSEAPAADAPAPEGDKPTPPEGEKPKGETPPEPEKAAPVALTADDIKIDLPEGVALAEEALGNFLTAANTAGLSKENAQALLKMHAEQVDGLVKDWVKVQTDTWTETNKAWRDEIAADPDIGSGNEKKTLEVIGRALDTYGSKEVRQALDLTGAGNNPHVTKLIYKMALALSEGSSVPGGQPAPKGKAGQTLGERLYGT